MAAETNGVSSQLVTTNAVASLHAGVLQKTVCEALCQNARTVLQIQILTNTKRMKEAEQPCNKSCNCCMEIQCACVCVLDQRPCTVLYIARMHAFRRELFWSGTSLSLAGMLNGKKT